MGILTALGGCCYHLLFDDNSSFLILGSGTRVGSTTEHCVALGNVHTSPNLDRGDSQP